MPSKALSGSDLIKTLQRISARRFPPRCNESSPPSLSQDAPGHAAMALPGGVCVMDVCHVCPTQTQHSGDLGAVNTSEGELLKKMSTMSCSETRASLDSHL